MGSRMTDKMMQALLQSSPIQFHPDPMGEPSFLDLDNEKERESKAKDQKRCGSDSCKKKLHLSDFGCGKCKTRFCSQHRLPEAHACQHDFKKEGKATLTAQNPRCVAEKMDRI